MSYLLVKHIHVTCVTASLGLFAFRLALAARGTDYRRVPALRWTPHLIDTSLLLSALWLAVQANQLPFASPWVTAKVIALPFYILFGALALSTRSRPTSRIVAAILAWLTAAYIVAVALTKHPVPWSP